MISPNPRMPTLRMIDDRRRKETAKIADRGGRERAAAQVVQLQFPLASLVAQALDLAGQGRDVFFVCVVEDRHDEAVRRGDGDADVIAVVKHDLTIRFDKACIDDRHFLQAAAATALMKNGR